MESQDQRPLCPECLAKGLKIYMHKSGKLWSGRKKVQRYTCNTCGRTTLNPKMTLDGK